MIQVGVQVAVYGLQ